MPGPLIPLGLGAVGAIGGWLGGREQRKAQEAQMQESRNRFNFAQNLLSPNRSAGLPGLSNLTELFPLFQQQMAPTFNVLGQQASLQGQQAAQGLQAGLGRLGLGATGLGASLGSGIQAGAAFQANALRARMMQDLFGEAINTQMGRASLAAGMPIPQMPTASPLMGAWQGFGSGAYAGDQYNRYGG